MTDRQSDPQIMTLSPQDAAALAQAGAGSEKAYRWAARPWFKKKRFGFTSAVLLVFLVIMVTTGGSRPGIFDVIARTPLATAESATTLTPARAVMGQSVRDGRFTFVVSSVQQPTKTLRDRSGATQSAQGLFLVVRVNVSNVGYEARALSATDQFLVNVQGQRFSTSAAISAFDGAEAIFEKPVNPGHTVNDAPVLFDIPAGTALASIELHDSRNTAGVTIKLS